MKKTEEGKIIPKKQDKELTIEGLLNKAVELKVDVGTMEKLLVMRKQLKEEKAKEEFFNSLSALQSELPILKKTHTVRNKDGSVRYKYTPFDEILKETKDLIKKHGFSYIIDSEVKETSVKAICKVIHSLGHSETSTFEVPIDKEGFMNEPQKFASALTYAKRYAFCNAFGILTADEDDDTAKTFEVKKSQVSSGTKKPQVNPSTCQHQWEEKVSFTGKNYKICQKCKKLEL